MQENVKSKPILFSTDMVRAILDGRKTMTRRILKAGFDLSDGFRVINVLENRFKNIGTHAFFTDDKITATVKCPYGNVGDELWVRETFQDLACFDSQLKGWAFKADYGMDDAAKEFKVNWRPSLFMPREACRLVLRITNIRVEQLMAISEDDSKKEGIDFSLFNENKWFYDYLAEEYSTCFPFISFRSLWVKINGESSWDKNPWVWVVEFEVKEVKHG